MLEGLQQQEQGTPPAETLTLPGDTIPGLPGTESLEKNKSKPQINNNKPVVNDQLQQLLEGLERPTEAAPVAP
jgi:hypothetical protein